MATKNPTITRVGSHTVVAFWENLTSADDGAWLPDIFIDYADRSVQVTGTFGVGGTLVIQGSNESTPTTAATLNDPSVTALSFTAAGIKQVLEQARSIRPNVTAGDGSTDLDVYMVCRRSRGGKEI